MSHICEAREALVFILGVPAVGLVQLTPCSGEAPLPTRVRGPVAYRLVSRPASYFGPRVTPQVPNGIFRLCGRHRGDPMFARSIVERPREARLSIWRELSTPSADAYVAARHPDSSP